MKTFWKKYNEIWEKVTNTIQKEINGKPVHNKKYLKTKLKSYMRKISTKNALCVFIYISNND